MFDITNKPPLSFVEYAFCTSKYELSGDDIWEIIRNGQTVRASYSTSDGDGQTGEFRLSEIHAINPISKLGSYRLKFHIIERYFEVIEDVVPPCCALEGRILMLSDPMHEGDTDIYVVTGERLKASLYRTYSRGQILLIEFYDDGEFVGQRYVSVPDDGLKRRIIDDQPYWIFINDRVAVVKTPKETISGKTK